MSGAGQLSSAPPFSAAPAGYLHNFLFVAAGTDVSSLLLDA